MARCILFALTSRPASRIAAFVLAVTSAVLLSPSCASAQSYPTRPITIVIPAPSGGPGDIPARLLADPMKTSLGQPLVVENFAGAGGSIGVTRVVRSAADGYTLILGSWNSNVASGAVYKLDYDLLKDLEPVALLTSAPMWIAARSDFPAKDFPELISWLKGNPDKALTAMVGVGTASHVCPIHLQNKTGTTLRFVPYKGGGPAYQDLMGGHVDLMCAETSATRPFMRAGKIKAYAVMAPTRWKGAPEIPTTDELGIPGLHISFWMGLWAPKGTPKDVIAKLNRAVGDSLADPTVRQRLQDLGLETPSKEQQTPEALAALQKSEIEKWWPVIKAANIKGD